jgi:TolB-like protein/tetratricopeptide (TPR) repeat protein
VKTENFFSELKRRNVYKVAVAYLVVAWLLIQAASILFPTFEAPPWVMKILVALLVLCFPVALVLSWAFEITPDGIRLESEIDRKQSITKKTGRKIIGLTIALAIVAAGLFAFQLLRSSAYSHLGEGRATPNDVTSASVGARASIPAKSIAVLPFDNLSRDPDNAYFCEGVQDEILTRLAKVADLKVISRTSTQHFKSAPDNLTEIARQLGVAHILEGSVQKSEDQVRVNVQLINGLNDAHLWADTYDRKLKDIFGVESEIAKTIADTLRAKLSGSEQQAIAARPTENTEAHQLYLKGRFFWNKRTGSDLKKSIEYFQQAIAADPNYALAYAGLADAYAFLPGYTAGSPKDSYPEAITAAKKALELDDSLAEAHTALAIAVWLYTFDFLQAMTEFERAIELNPNYAIAHQQYANVLLTALGRFDEAIVQGKHAVELDPLSLVINADLGVDYFFARHYDEAIAQLRKTLEMGPDYYYAHVDLGQPLEMKGARDLAIAEYKRARELNDDPYILGLLARCYGLSGNKTEAEKILSQLKYLSKQRYVAAYSFALTYIGLSDKEEALRWVEQSYQDRAGSDIGWIRVDPLLDPLRGDARFEEIAEKIVPAREFHGSAK